MIAAVYWMLAFFGMTGRLIDADELKKKFKHGKNDTVIDSAWTSTIRRTITAAHTIIERSEE